MRWLALLFAVLPLAWAGAEEDSLRVLPENKELPVNRMLRRHLIAECKEYFARRKAEVAALKTPQDVVKRQAMLREQFLAAIQEPQEKTPLHPVVVGRIPQDGYTVEKVIFQSRPNHHVTASFYLPAGKGPFPGAIMPIGHSTNGKAADYVQRGCILLAKNGIAALAYDPIGQGERRQMLDGEGKVEAAVKSSTNEHTLTMVGGLLAGRTTAGYRIWDGIRALDYLASRPEIDPERLGCTGCSGGGTLTSYLMALDPRIKVAAPSCYLTSLERLFDTIGPQDGEQNIPGQVSFGLDHADYLLLHAPQPVVILAAERDFFDIGGTRSTFAEAERIYGLFGAASKIELVVSPTSHGYPKQHREPAVQFFAKWLLQKEGKVVEPDFAILKDSELQCTPTGQVLADLKGKSVFDLNLERADQLAAARKAKPTKSGQFHSDFRWLMSCLDGPVPIVTAKGSEPKKIAVNDGVVVKTMRYTTAHGIEVPAVWLHPENAKSGTIIVAHEGGKEAAFRLEQVQAWAKKDRRKVVALDLRGWGETAPGAKGEGIFGPDVTETFLALHVAVPLLVQRTEDLVAVVKAIKGTAEDEDIEVVGFGAGGIVAMHAAAFEPDLITSLTTESSLARWYDIVRQPLGPQHFADVVPGALAKYDLPELLDQLENKNVTIRRPVDAFGKAYSAAEAKEIYGAVKRAIKLEP